MIRESIIITLDAEGRPHIRPLGLTTRGEHIVLAPFIPSRTLDNLRRDRCAVINYTTDVRIFAGTLTGRYDWPVVPASRIAGVRLRDTLTHQELEVEEIEEDPVRPRFICRVVYSETHRPFMGFNRAQAAVLEAAILVSRLERLPMEKINAECEHLRIALDKTAGDEEREAWEWLMGQIEIYRRRAARA
jgi:uncharacterized protein